MAKVEQRHYELARKARGRAIFPSYFPPLELRALDEDVAHALADAEARAVQPWREALRELLRSTEEFVRMSDQTTQEVEDAIYKARALLAEGGDD